MVKILKSIRQCKKLYGNSKVLVQDGLDRAGSFCKIFVFFVSFFLTLSYEKIEREKKERPFLLNFQIEFSQRKRLELKNFLLQSCLFF
jgi:hypothetical protein